MVLHIRESILSALILAAIVWAYPCSQDRALKLEYRQALPPGPPNPCQLTTNPDISGLGVRVSFYAQGFIAIFAPHGIFRFEESVNFLRSALLTSISLVLTTIIYGRKPDALSILDGLLVTFLPIIIGAAAQNQTSAGGILTNPETPRSLKLLYMVEVLLSAGFSVYVWATVDTYGSPPGCNVNSTAKFVVFGYTVMATNVGLRVFALLYFAITMALTPFAFKFLFLTQTPDPDLMLDTPRVVTWAWTSLLIGTWVYSIVTVEQIILRNGVTGITNKWTYGQTLSVALLLCPAFDLASRIWSKMHDRLAQTHDGHAQMHERHGLY